MSEMPNIDSLPEDLLLAIGAHLNELELCSIELAGTRFHNVLSRPNASTPCKLSLDLLNFCPPTPEQSRSPAQLASSP